MCARAYGNWVSVRATPSAASISRAAAVTAGRVAPAADPGDARWRARDGDHGDEPSVATEHGRAHRAHAVPRARPMLEAHPSRPPCASCRASRAERRPVGEGPGPPDVARVVLRRLHAMNTLPAEPPRWAARRRPRRTCASSLDGFDGVDADPPSHATNVAAARSRRWPRPDAPRAGWPSVAQRRFPHATAAATSATGAPSRKPGPPTRRSARGARSDPSETM